jgi:hypothetical protein
MNGIMAQRKRVFLCRRLFLLPCQALAQREPARQLQGCGHDSLTYTSHQHDLLCAYSTPHAHPASTTVALASERLAVIVIPPLFRDIVAPSPAVGRER